MIGVIPERAKTERAEILHVDLRAPHRMRVIARFPLYWVIFWWGDRPVGQYELAVSIGIEVDLGALAAKAVEADALKFAQAAFEKTRPAAALGERVSVVICTRDRPVELQRCLASFPRQSRMPDEIVVVDNASADNRTREVALAAGVEYFREDRPGLDLARNAGVLAAAGDLILFTDDDVVLHPLWLERMVDAFDENIDAVTGLVLPGELETFAQLHFERYWGFGKGFRRIDFGSSFFEMDRSTGCPAWEIGAGASMGFRAKLFREIGLFDERLDVGAAGCSGDSEYWHRVLFHGRRCRYDPAVVAFHFHRREIAGLRRQLRAYMRGHSAALLIQYERSGNHGNLRRLLWSIPPLVYRALVEPTCQPI